MLNPEKKYNLEYYLGVVDKVVNMGAHILGIKDSEFIPSRSGFILRTGLSAARRAVRTLKPYRKTLNPAWKLPGYHCIL
jgi:pyruvate carboxylase